LVPFSAARVWITYLNSSKYQKESLKTKAFACITSLNLSKFLPEKCIKLDVKNVLFAVTEVSRLFYPNADLDYPDLNLMDSNSIKDMYPKVKFGKNVMIGKDVKIGNDSFIGTNSIIESKVEIGSDCIIGSSVVLKNALIGFPGEEKHWGEIVNSRGGFKALTKTINNHGLGG